MTNQTRKVLNTVIIIASILGAFVLIGAFGDLHARKQYYDEAQTALQQDDIDGALDAYTDLYKRGKKGRKINEARDFISSYFENLPISDPPYDSNAGKFEEYADKLQGTELASRIIDVLSDKIDEEYQAAKQTATIDGWDQYRRNVGPDYWKDADEQIRKIEEAAWSTEPTAWAAATKSDTKDSYERYLRLYPDGAHARQAEKLAIDKAVADIFAGGHGNLPQMDRLGGAGGVSRITVTNGTKYTLTLLYSGPVSKRIELPSSGTRTVTLTNGIYQIAASVNDSSVAPYAGIESLDGGEYGATFVIDRIGY